MVAERIAACAKNQLQDPDAEGNRRIAEEEDDDEDLITIEQQLSDVNDCTQAVITLD